MRPSSTTTATATRTCCSSTRSTGPASGAAGRDAGALPQRRARTVRRRDRAAPVSTSRFYGKGVAVGDYDDDGDVDVFLTASGAEPPVPQRRRPVRRRDRAAPASPATPTPGARSAGFFDYDDDGDLDLFVCNYVEWSREIDLQLDFTLNGVDRAYGPPKLYEGTHSYLYRNDGDGTFRDVSAEAGIQVDNPATGRPDGQGAGA